MATRFGSAQLLAQKLILKNGRTITFTRKGTTPINAAEPWLGNTGDTTVPNVPAVFVDYSLRERQNSLIQDGDKRALVAALDLSSFTPTTKDKILDNGKTYEIVSIQTTAPGNTDETIMYELQLRG